MACCAKCAAKEHAIVLPPPGDIKYWSLVAGVAVGSFLLGEKLEKSKWAGYLAGTMQPTPDGTPMRELMSPAAAWGLGAAPMLPTAAERHAPMDTNPAPEDATPAQIREEWRAHKAVARAIEKGTLVRPGPHNRKAKNYMQAHHPDYSKPLAVRWETKAEHVGMDHKY